MIYYPHYTPSNQHLRSILLFSDQIKLLVPDVDQDGVRRREHIRGLIKKDPNLIELKNPQYLYDAWASHCGTHSVIQNIIRIASDCMSSNGVPPIKKDKFGNLEPGQESIIKRLRSDHGWKYVAAEKFPSKIHAAVFDSNCAARAGIYTDETTGRTIEHNGVICHPLLADFVLCRMARQASFEEALPSITFGGANYMDHLLDGEQLLNSPQQELMQASLDLFVPDNISSLSVDDFFFVRDEYSNIRNSVSEYLSSMVKTENLDMTSADASALFHRLTATREKIRQELVDVSGAIGRQRFLHGSALALEAAATLGGAALGAAVSGVQGAMVGAGIGFAGGKSASLLSTVGYSNGRLKSVAMTKAKIERMGLRKRWNAPSHWTQ
jgi:hypothetical protein